MAGIKLTLTVPADYVGYVAMKIALGTIVTRAREEPVFTGQDAAEIAEDALAYVESVEAKDPRAEAT